jgi:hypothetical protein
MFNIGYCFDVVAEDEMLAFNNISLEIEAKVYWLYPHVREIGEPTPSVLKDTLLSVAKGVWTRG